MKYFNTSGLLCLHDAGDSDNILFLSNLRKPLVKELNNFLPYTNKYYKKHELPRVNVRYWISDKQMDKSELQEEYLKTVMGLSTSDYGAHYSDLTGYLWTDEEWNVGGHDLVTEFKSNVGKWLTLEIELYEKGDAIPI
jgi:hypothetical protein